MEPRLGSPHGGAACCMWRGWVRAPQAGLDAAAAGSAMRWASCEGRLQPHAFEFGVHAAGGPSGRSRGIGTALSLADFQPLLKSQLLAASRAYSPAPVHSYYTFTGRGSRIVCHQWPL